MDKTRTLAIIKPDISCNNILTFNIGNLAWRSGLLIEKQTTRQLTKQGAMEFYAEHKGKEFFDRLTSFMSSGNCVVWILEGENAITKWRELMKQIRAKYSGKELHENCVHGSDSPEAAEREIKFFFNK